jgi:putative dehydrogenase
MTKGFMALATTMVNAAAREGLADALRAELSRTQPGFLARLERSIPDMFPKAYRWVAEMEQIAEFVGSTREGANIYDGAARLYEWIASELERGNSDSIEALGEFCKKK